MRFPRQASMASRSPLSPLPTNPPASVELLRTKQVAARETRKRSASVVDLETCVGSSAPAAAKSEPGAGESAAAAAICKRSDGRGWRCKNAAAEGSSLCGHHLARYVARTNQGHNTTTTSRTRKKAATKAQKCNEKKNTHEEEKALHMDPEVYNAAYILCQYISEFWSESHAAADVVLVEEMNGGDHEDDDGDDEKDDDEMGGDAAASATAVHDHEGFLASD